MINADGRKGPIRVNISGAPMSLKLYISDVFTDPTGSNATYIYSAPKYFELDPKKFHAKENKRTKVKGKESAPPDRFKQLYIKFTANTDCKFSVDVFFPLVEEKL